MRGDTRPVRTVRVSKPQTDDRPGPDRGGVRRVKSNADLGDPLSVDEIVAHGAYVHVEQLDRNLYWLAVDGHHFHFVVRGWLRPRLKLVLFWVDSGCDHATCHRMLKPRSTKERKRS